MLIKTKEVIAKYMITKLSTHHIILLFTTTLKNRTTVHHISSHRSGGSGKIDQ